MRCGRCVITSPKVPIKRFAGCSSPCSASSCSALLQCVMHLHAGMVPRDSLTMACTATSIRRSGTADVVLASLVHAAAACMHLDCI